MFNIICEYGFLMLSNTIFIAAFEPWCGCDKEIVVGIDASSWELLTNARKAPN